MTPNFDFLGIGDSARFGSERVLLSTDVFHFTQEIEPTPLDMVITQSSIFLSKNNSIVRQLDLCNIESITASTNSTDFVLHSFDTPDDRFACPLNRSAVLRMIFYLKTRSKSSNTSHPYADHPPDKLRVYLVPDLSLDIYTTTDRDIQEMHIIRPDEKYGHLVSYKEFVELDQKQTEKKEAKSRSTRTLFTRGGSRAITIDDFELLKTLGRGSHGKVILCRKRNEKDELYAMKIIKKMHIIESNHITHTLAEKTILSGMNHPFLVSLRHAFQSDRKIYFVMEFMRGGELFQHLRKVKRFEETQVRFIAACIIMALGHLHNKDYIYRDIKPENILLDEKGFAVLTDFGLAKMLTVNDVARTFCGTPEYLAPEVILDKGCNRQADWWGLGILVYELLFGIPPFYSQDVQEMYKKTLLDNLKFPNRVIISPEAKDFVAGLLVKAPSKRLGSIADSLEVMNHPWFKDFNWGKLLDKSLTPPYTPNIKNIEENFDPSILKDIPIDSFCVVDPALVQKFEQEFKVFDFNNNSESDDKGDMSPVRSSPSLLRFWKDDPNQQAEQPPLQESKVTVGEDVPAEHLAATPDTRSGGIKTPPHADADRETEMIIEPAELRPAD